MPRSEAKKVYAPFILSVIQAIIRKATNKKGSMLNSSEIKVSMTASANSCLFFLQCINLTLFLFTFFPWSSTTHLQGLYVPQGSPTAQFENHCCMVSAVESFVLLCTIIIHVIQKIAPNLHLSLYDSKKPVPAPAGKINDRKL